jgi:hypothetical protein
MATKNRIRQSKIATTSTVDLLDTANLRLMRARELPENVKQLFIDHLSSNDLEKREKAGGLMVDHLVRSDMIYTTHRAEMILRGATEKGNVDGIQAVLNVFREATLILDTQAEVLKAIGDEAEKALAIALARKE